MKSGILTFLVTLSSFGLAFSTSSTTTTGEIPTCFIAPTIDFSTIVCDDNGTPFDDSDDIITYFEVLVDGENDETNPPASNTFNADVAPSSTIPPGVPPPYPYGTILIYSGSFTFGSTITYTDVDDPTNCTATIVLNTTCSDATCEIMPEAPINNVCDDNGTPFDPSDDTFTFEITVNGSNTDMTTPATNTFNDDQGNTGIAYGTTLSYGPFPISGGTVMVNYTDADAPADVGCAAVMMAIPPSTCSDAMCEIIPDPAANIVCDDNGTEYDPSDDTFTFEITVNGSNTDMTTPATNTFNDDQGNTGIAYGTTISYGPFPIDGGPIIVTYIDADAPADVGCTATMMASPPPTCSPAMCTIGPNDPAPSVCDDNGTPFDASDDTYTFTVTVDGSNTASGATNTFNDDQGNTGIAYGTMLTYGPFPISGGPTVVTYTDVDAPADVGCTEMVVGAPPKPCSDAECSITPEAPVVACDNNGTPFDASDDTFTFTITVDGSNTASGATNTFNDDQGNTDIAYGTTLSYGPFPISGGAVEVAYSDADAPAGICDATMMAIPPSTCSNATCEIIPDPAADIVCDNNGTEFDPSDDTYTFTITVNGSNTDITTPATNTFNDDQGNTGIAYGTTVSYGPFPISGGPIVVTYTDADAPADVGCTASMMASPPPTCSVATCNIIPEAAIVSECDDNGTPFDNSDDTFTFDITVNGNNDASGATNTFNDDQGNTGIAYGTTLSYGPFPISGGPVIVTYTDADAPADLVPPCEEMMMAVPPAPCEPAECMVEPEPAADIICDDNGTPFDASDDTYTFTVTVNGENTDMTTPATNTFNDDQGNTGIAYGTTLSYGPFPISGGPITVTYTDADAPVEVGCSATITAIPPPPCIVDCIIEPEPAIVSECDDNGTPFDGSDDTFTFMVTVNGPNVPGASNTFNDDQGNAGIVYGTTLSYGPFPISGGSITVTYTDADAPVEANCTAIITAVPPEACPVECMIEPEITNIDCDDNGTPDDRTDDTYTFDVIVNGSNNDAGATNTFNDDQGNSGTYGTTLSYGPFLIFDGNVTVVYSDADLPDICTATLTADTPPTCSDEAEVPTVGEWGLIILGLLMSITAVVGIRQRREEEAYS